MSHSLTVEHLAKLYKHRWVVNDISLQMRSGEIVGLLGPNGAGKTTCFYMIVGLIAADRGLVKLDNHNLTRLPMHTRAQHGIAYLPQEPSVFRKLTVEQNILAILELNDKLSKRQRQLHLNALLKEFNIEHIRRNLGISLSGGERRRVEIARALARDPKFILLDEPFAGVDPISIIDIKRIIRQLQAGGIGILITDHNVRDTLDICERAYIVSDGKLIADGEPKTILQNQLVRDVYLGQEFSLAE